VTELALEWKKDERCRPQTDSTESRHLTFAADVSRHCHVVVSASCREWRAVICVVIQLDFRSQTVRAQNERYTSHSWQFGNVWLAARTAPTGTWIIDWWVAQFAAPAAAARLKIVFTSGMCVCQLRHRWTTWPLFTSVLVTVTVVYRVFYRSIQIDRRTLCLNTRVNCLLRCSVVVGAVA